MTTEFNDLSLHPQLVQAVAERGYTSPTPIQAGVVPVMLTGKDILGQAQTGTGKTAAFALPILHNITPGLGPVQALVLAPTRELGLQVAEAMEIYGRFRQISVLAVYGGTAYGPQIGALQRGVDVVVGTPGRLLDLLKSNKLDLSQVQTIVLDEADEMLSMGFIEDIEAILEATPAERQTALFSATLPRQIRHLADKYMTEPEAISIERSQRTVAAIEQRAYLVNEKDKLAALTRLFEMEPISSALIFARTRLGTAELANELSVRGFPAEALNGDLSQQAREQVLNRFRKNQIKVLVATDVAARGLDIDDISHVFNFDLPQDSEIYVHRVGRTGRAGRTGIALSLVTPKEQWRLRKIEQYTKQKVTQIALPTIEDIQNRREAELLEKMSVWLRRGRCARERELVAELAKDGHDLLEIAAVALKLARAEEKQRPIARISEVVAEPSRRGRRGKFGNGRTHKNKKQSSSNGRGENASHRSHERGMVRMSLSAGKVDGLRVNDVVGTIAFHADIPGSTIGAIHIQDDRTLVDVPEQFAQQVLDKTGNYRVRKKRLSIERA
ncbi:DEAD/DEAH box helicase [Candidatus Leptofilum sp.]|uniref:DEAD/DEAH box helicase n=1 Tax=Candidatus Leptofilum sp. TaxID=3241576 RepID=UPI003B5BE8BF